MRMKQKLNGAIGAVFIYAVGVRHVLERHGSLIPSFFDNRENLLQFSEVLEHGYAALSDCEDHSTFANSAFLNQALLNEKVKVLLENAAVNVSFVHDVCQLQWSTMS
jgi:hypothetical protein